MAAGRNSPLPFHSAPLGRACRGAEKAANKGPGKQNTAPPKQSPAEICKLITVLGNLGGDTTQDASCSAEIREFPGSHCPASLWGQKSWQGARRNVRKVLKADTSGGSAPCSPLLIPGVFPQMDLQTCPASRWLWGSEQVALPPCASVSPPAEWGCRWDLPQAPLKASL